MNASILLEDGTTIAGKGFGAEGTVIGEIVFNTGMTGYQEILTDPSYYGQIVLMTYPLVGNYGINYEDVESDSIKVKGFIAKEYCQEPSNYKSQKPLEKYFKENNILGVYDVDTRMITKKIRNVGAMKCIITTDTVTDDLKEKLISFSFPKDTVARVSRKSIEKINGNNQRIGVLDFGVKQGIINQLESLDCDIHLLPWDTSINKILELRLDGLLLSNGPGNPKDLTETVKRVKKLLGNVPMFGICLGHQILALALEGDTYKLKFGHRGSNHPVLDLRNNKVFITSQNHGYNMANIHPDIIKITHVNVNDKTIEGFECPKYNIQAVQFHPEAGPGPTDANYLFKEWIDKIRKEDSNVEE